MGNCSIPNSIPANGRISTRSLRRSKRPNSAPRTSVSVTHRSALSIEKRRRVAALQSALCARKIQSAIGNRQSSIRRVKGAWWPSRSSKPSSPRKWRGRFDSYPLRHLISDLRFAILDCPTADRAISIANRNSKIENCVKGGETVCRVNKSGS